MSQYSAGDQTQLATSGETRNTVVSRGIASLDFSAQAALDGVMAVGGDLVEP